MEYTDRTIIAEHMRSAKASVGRALKSGNLMDVWDAAKTIGFDEAMLHGVDQRTKEQVYRIGVALSLRVTRDMPLVREPIVGYGGSWPEGLEAVGSHLAKCDYCPERFNCSCGRPGQGHMCPRCDAAAEDSKMIQLEGDPGERADEARQEEGYEAPVEHQLAEQWAEGVNKANAEELPW